MVSAIVLLTTERTSINEVAQALVDLDGVSEVFSVAGKYDLVAIIRVMTNEQLADLVTRQMLQIENILSSETLIAFQALSQFDLESLFSIGFD